MADSDDHLEVDALGLADQVIQLCLGFGLQDRLVDVEERVGSEGDLLADGSGGASRRTSRRSRTERQEPESRVTRAPPDGLQEPAKAQGRKTKAA